MKFAFTKISLSMAALSVALLSSAAATAADNHAARIENAPPPAAVRDGIDHSDRERMKGWSDDKQQLERDLRLGEHRAFYTRTLADRGFLITSVNSDKPDAAEYEVVKGTHTYEVQLDFDNAGKATKVDVTTNVWRSEATKAAMKGERVPVAMRFEQGNESYSERSQMRAWSDEKDRLERSLGTGHDKAFYSQRLSDLGYQVTSVNDSSRDYVEYEVVKGANSFEVQIDFENGMAKEVDVTTNLWKSDATERALSAAQR